MINFYYSYLSTFSDYEFLRVHVHVFIFQFLVYVLSKYQISLKFFNLELNLSNCLNHATWLHQRWE